MGVFARVRDIFSANVNSMLDKAEDPEKMVRLMIREMEDALIEVKASLAGLMAARRKVERDLAETGAREQDWESKAELAVERGREDLAREALLERRRYAERTGGLNAELAHLDALAEQARGDMRTIQDKLKTVRERERLLVQRHKTAHRRVQTQQTIRRAATADILARFERFESEIERVEAAADLVNHGRKPTLEDSFANMERDAAIERELDAIKAKKRPAYSVVA